MKNSQFYQQTGTMDSGPTCLPMVAKRIPPFLNKKPPQSISAHSIMNKFLTLFFIVYISNFKLCAQDINYIRYKQDCNKAYCFALDSLDYDGCIKTLYKVKGKYDFLFCEEYVLLSYCYKKINRNTKSAKFLRSAWGNYAFDLNCLMQIDEIQPFKIMEGFSKHQNKIVSKGFIEAKKLRTNVSDSLLKVFARIDSLDQLVRTEILPDSNANTIKLQMEKLRYVDSLNLIEFKNIIYKFGYPGEKLLSGNSESSSLILIHSSYNKTFYNEMKPVFLEEVRKGRMSPSHYVLWLDRHNLAFNLPLEYGILDVISENNFTESQKAEIYKRRMELGLIKHFPLPSKQLQF